MVRLRFHTTRNKLHRTGQLVRVQLCEPDSHVAAVAAVEAAEAGGRDPNTFRQCPTGPGVHIAAVIGMRPERHATVGHIELDRISEMFMEGVDQSFTAGSVLFSHPPIMALKLRYISLRRFETDETNPSPVIMVSTDDPP